MNDVWYLPSFQWIDVQCVTLIQHSIMILVGCHWQDSIMSSPKICVLCGLVTCLHMDNLASWSKFIGKAICRIWNYEVFVAYQDIQTHFVQIRNPMYWVDSVGIFWTLWYFYMRSETYFKLLVWLPKTKQDVLENIMNYLNEFSGQSIWGVVHS